MSAQVGFDSHSNGDAHSAVWADFDNDGRLDLFIGKGTVKTDPLTTMTYGTITAMGPSLT